MEAQPTANRLQQLIWYIFAIAAVTLLIAYVFHGPTFKSQLAAHGMTVVQGGPSSPLDYPLALTNEFTGHVTPSRIVQVNTVTATDQAAALCSQMPNLELASLNGRELSDDGLAHFVSCSQLKELSLANTSIHGTGLRHLQGCASLVRLDLTNTNVGDTSIEQITQLASVQKLFLSGPQISDRSLPHLFNMPNLSVLYLQNTCVTETACQSLADAHLQIKCTLVAATHLVQISPKKAPVRVPLTTGSK